MKTIYKYVVWILVCVFAFTSCTKIENVDNRINIIYSNAKAKFINNTTAQIKFRFYPNSVYNNKEVLEPNFFKIDTSSWTIGDNSFSAIYTMKELSRTVVTKPAGSLSLLVLIDKNVQKLVNEEYYFSLRNKLVDYLKSTSGYEISFAGFAQNNPFMRKSFQPIFSGFKSSINDIPTDSLNFMFDVGTNGGTNNKYAALDSGLNYINKNAHYANKAILFVTDPNYNNADITLHNQLISKANTYNTSINIFDSYQSPDEYSFLKLSSQTGGMICNHVSSDVIASSFDLFVPALFDYLTGKKYYEWLIEVKTDKDFFNKVTWALFYSRLKLYDGNSTEFNLIYEK